MKTNLEILIKMWCIFVFRDSFWKCHRIFISRNRVRKQAILRSRVHVQIDMALQNSRSG